MAIAKDTDLQFPAKRHKSYVRKAIQDAEAYSPATASDWTSLGLSAPAWQDDALDSLASHLAGAAGGELIASGTIATGAVLTLDATPVTLIAAPGAGKVIVVEQVQLFLDYNSAAYSSVDASDDVIIEYATGGVDIAVVTGAGFLDQTADTHRLVLSSSLYQGASEAAGFDPMTADNEAVRVKLGGAITTGNSPLKWQVKYRIVQLLV